MSDMDLLMCAQYLKQRFGRQLRGKFIHCLMLRRTGEQIDASVAIRSAAGGENHMPKPRESQKSENKAEALASVRVFSKQN
eukprot:6208269-Pleurochrysis_carterae.AAC.1